MMASGLNSNLKMNKLVEPGWVFFEEEDIEKSRQMFSDYQGSGTVDELGFGILYDEVATSLFPWCSTLTTRAKYFHFSIAVMICSLQSTVEPLTEVERSDRSLIRQKAIRSVPRYMKRVRELEKYLGFSIYFIDPEAEGLFGSRKIRNWATSDSGRIFTRYRDILQDNTRYPNRIYRGAMRSLNAFENEASDVQIVENFLIGKNIFRQDWLDNSESLILQMTQIFENWDELKLNAEKKQITFPKVKDLIFKDLKKISGFRLREHESKFLKKKIYQASPYMQRLSQKELYLLFSDNTKGLLELSKGMEDKVYRDQFASAFHLNQITSPFNELYQQISKNSEGPYELRGNWRNIQSSFDWICRNYAFNKWNDDYKSLFEDWISYGKSKMRFGKHDRMVEGLKDRADRIVRDGRNKTPPHRKTNRKPDESDIQTEIGFTPSSFRLWNASRIMNDILSVENVTR